MRVCLCARPQVLQIAGVRDPSQLQLVFLDSFADGPYAEMWKQAFSPSRPVLHASDRSVW